MDLSKIKARLDALNQTNQGSTDMSAYFWKPDFGKNIIRIVPSAYDKDNPFTELTFHKVLTKYPILALSNYGEQDPVEDFIKKLRETSSKENWSLSGKLSPRTSYFVPVIVRGEEDKGVRIWQIGITMYKSLLQLAGEEEVGDYTDIVEGRDLTVTKVKGDPYPEISIMPKMSKSPLSDNANQVKTWLENQPKPVDCFRHAEYDYIKKQLEAYLTGGATAGEKKIEEQPVEQPAVPEKKAEEPVAKKVAPSKLSVKFDDLFGDDNVSKDGDNVDDLPF